MCGLPAKEGTDEESDTLTGDDGLSHPAGGRAASAITYGHPDGNRQPYVGALVGADEQGEFVFCSGTLIAPDVFLTAAHCTAAIEQFGFEFRGVTFDNVFDPDTSVVYPGMPHTHPDFPGPSSDVKDIAVVVLDEEVTGIQPALLPSAGLLDQLANDDDLKGQSFTAVGYGATERTHEPGSGAPIFGEDGTRMYSVSTFAALNKTFLRLSQNPSTGDAGTCYGDSGGPNSWATHASSLPLLYPGTSRAEPRT